MTASRDHGGGLDAAIERFGGNRDNWLDLSTGINPVPYPVQDIPARSWTALPDADAVSALEQAARVFWDVPENAAILAAPGASALIARNPAVRPPGSVQIAQITYNEHAAAFQEAGWQVLPELQAEVRVVVHPNNPDGQMWDGRDPGTELTVIDESFCDVCPEASLIARTAAPGTLILKSFGKFWGLAGLRLGFAIGDPSVIDKLAAGLGPWPVSGPALTLGAKALSDTAWSDATRERLAADSARLDRLMTRVGASAIGGTTLFRLYKVDDAAAWQARLANCHIWSRIFPYSKTWLRLGLPAPDRWAQLEEAL